MSSALALKMRTGTLSIATRAAALAMWHGWYQRVFNVTPVTTADFATAASFADRYALGLRAGDALHLAVAARTGLHIVTLDKIMAAAAPILGIPVAPL